MPSASSRLEPQSAAKKSFGINWALVPVCAIAAIFTCMLLWQLRHRVVFPWDKAAWPESPFMVDMLKLDHHLPVYSRPQDCNSFVYSPGLEYITFAVLKPFGKELDIRYCRLVNVLIGMAAAGIAVIPIMRLSRSLGLKIKPALSIPLLWATMWLVLSQNLLSDIPHPDNLHALHAALVFCLCFASLETKSFRLAVLTMAAAALGVFAKQTGAICMFGPLLVFGFFNPWGWRRWCILVAAGLVALGVALYLVWLPEYSRFYTFELLRHHDLARTKLRYVIKWMFFMKRIWLMLLTIAAVIWLWRWPRGGAKHYLFAWIAVGIFSTSPNLLAFIKANGIENNLAIFEFWKGLLVLPLFLFIADRFNTSESMDASRTSLHPAIVMGLYAFYVVALVDLMPRKSAPLTANYAYCKSVEDAVRQDLQAGRRILVTHGAEFFIHCGSTDIPMDQSNSAYEIHCAHRDDLLGELTGRLRNHSYDKLYVMIGGWYGPELQQEIERNYKIESIVPETNNPRDESMLCQECRILVPR